MEIKMADRPLWKMLAILPFIMAALLFWKANNTFSPLGFYLSGIFFILLGLNFLDRKKLTYLTLKNGILTIHLRRIALSKRKIKYSEIKKVEVLDKEVILHLENERKYKLNKDWISYDDLSDFREKLELNSVSFR